MPVKNGWTGGQYSLYRWFFGAYLFVHFVHLIPWGTEIFSDRGVLPTASASPVVYFFPNILALADGPIPVAGILTSAAALSLFFTVGFKDRWAAGALWYVWACLYGRNPLISNPGLPYVGWLLLAHVFIPSSPYGSWSARGRLSPGGDWRTPPEIFGAAWILMALGYSYSGCMKWTSPSWIDGSALARVLDNPLARPGIFRDAVLNFPGIFLRIATWGALALETGFVLIALVRPLRPILWAAALAMHMGLIFLIDFADLSLGMAVLHFFTFNPAWVPGIRRTGKDAVFYDGHCGLCHGAVRFILAEDVNGNNFRLAPLQSGAFLNAVPESRRGDLPDSIVLLRADGALLVKSQAVLHILKSLGGVWRIGGTIFSIIPESIRDVVYDGVARVRRRLFPQPKEACPLLPADLRERFMI